MFNCTSSTNKDILKNQHPSYDRYAEMTHFLNHATTKSKYSILNTDPVQKTG